MAYGYMYNFGYGFPNGYNPLVNYTWSTTVSSDYITDGVELVTDTSFDLPSGDGYSEWRVYEALQADIVGGVFDVHTSGAGNLIIEYDRNISVGDLLEITLDSNDSFTLNFNGAWIAFASGVNKYYITSTAGTYFKVSSGGTPVSGTINSISVQKVIQKPNTMYLKDSGVSPKLPAELHSGQGVLFNGVDNLINIGTVHAPNDYSLMFNYEKGVTTYSYMLNLYDIGIFFYQLGDKFRIRFWEGGNLTDFEPIINDGNNQYILTYTKNSKFEFYINGVKTDEIEALGDLAYGSGHELGGRATSSSYSDFIAKDLYIFNDTITPQEISKYSTDPNGFFQDVQDGVIDNCVLNMPLDGTDEYVRDYANYSEGAEAIINGTFDTDTNWTKGTGWTIASGNASYDGTGGTSSISQSGSSLTNGEIYLVSIDILSNEGTGTNVIDIGADRVNEEHLPEGHYDFIYKAANTGNILIYGRSGEVFEIDNVSIKQLSGIHKIDNYTNGCRNEVDVNDNIIKPTLLNYGTQELNFTRNGLWRGDLSEYLEMHNVNHYSKSSGMSMNDIKQIDFVYNEDANNRINYNKLFMMVDSSNSSIIRCERLGTGGSLYFIVGSENTGNYIALNEPVHIVYEFDTVNNTVSVYRNGTQVGTSYQLATPVNKNDGTLYLANGNTTNRSILGRMSPMQFHSILQDPLELYNNAVSKGLLT